MTNILPFDSLDPRIQRTRSLLFEAYVDLLKEKHFALIRVQDITKAARINRATFYNHFNNYEEFIIFCAREGFRRELAVKYNPVRFECNQSNLLDLTEWVLSFMSSEFGKWHYQWDEILFEKAMRIEFYFFLVKWFAQSDEGLDFSLFSDTDALLLSSSIVGLGMVWCESGCKVSKEELSKKITHAHTSGLATFNAG